VSAADNAVLDSPIKYAPDPDALGDVVAFIAHGGASPLGLTQDKTSGEIIVADLFSGTAYRYDSGLTTNLGTIPIPAVAGTCSGVAFNETTGNTLFWLFGDTQVQETDMTGTPIGAPFSVTSAGLPAGVSYDISGTDSNPSLWFVDIANDLIVEVDLTGAVKSSFPQPGGGGTFGNGMDNTGNVIDALWGLPASSQPTTVTPVEYDGTNAGFLDTPVTTTGDTFVNDVVRGEFPPGTQVLYLVGNATNTIYMVETEQGVPVELMTFDVE